MKTTETTTTPKKKRGRPEAQEGHVFKGGATTYILLNGERVNYKHYRWEQVHGPIPKKHILKVKDGCTDDMNPDSYYLGHRGRNSAFPVTGPGSRLGLTPEQMKARHLDQIKGHRLNSQAQRKAEKKAAAPKPPKAEKPPKPAKAPEAPRATGIGSRLGLTPEQMKERQKQKEADKLKKEKADRYAAKQVRKQVTALKQERIKETLRMPAALPKKTKPAYVHRHVDMTHRVQVAKGTWVVVKAGETEQQTIEQYHQNRETSYSRFQGKKTA